MLPPALLSPALLPPAVPPRAVIVHGAEDVRAVLGVGRPVVLLSAPWAGCYGGARWWRRVVDAAAGRAAADILDCGNEAGRAVEALGEGCRRVVLDPACPAFADVADRAAAVGACLLDAAPPALDMGMKGAARRLPAWLDGTGAAE